MSFSVKKLLNFPQGGLNYEPHYEASTQQTNDSKLIGGVLHDTHYIWQAKGPILEARNTKTGSKVGAWVFGGILKDSNTKIVCVEELQRPNGRISLLVVGIECTISGGIICIFDVFSSKVIRAIQIKEKISSLHVVDPGIEDLNLPGPLRNFDGILAVGTDGGDVILIDICRQICEESFHTSSKRDELNPSQVVLLTAKHMPKIEHYKEKAVRDGNHLAIHLNAVLENRTEHFVLKGPKGDDRIHVNKEEVQTSAIYYCSQLTSLLIGYNFGAFQLWDLTTLKLVYTSPVCEEHFSITNFALQEPTDDPRAFCYVWVSYSNTELLQMGLPFAVMYALCYESKEFHEGYGYLYQDFHYCNIRFQIELGQIEEHRSGTVSKGGYCLGLQPITKLSTSKESFSHSTTCDTLALCLISWTVWFSKSDTQTYALVFDLNQWYKEQMPSFTKWKDCNNYILRTSLSDLVIYNGHKQAPLLNVLLCEKSLTQFMGVQKLEEHFYPTSLSFNMWVLRESDVILIFSQGLQKSLLAQIESAGPLCLVRPTDVCKQAITLGLTPLFIDIPPRALSVDSQREVILNVALEHQLIGWLCKCASEWANGSFSSAGCSLDFLITWAFQRAVVLKQNCDTFCGPLFDYSQSRLDANTSVLLNSCTRQISSLCTLYKHIVGKLKSFVSCPDLVKDHWNGLEMVSVYFEVLQWLVNVGLLPECHPSTYPRPDNSERISAPYPVQELTEHFTQKRAELRLLSKESFESSDSLLFIDNLINRKCGGSRLQAQWQEDGGSGLYPPPSLQSLVRTYLVDGAGLYHKHSLIIYLFLDLAMALDQSRYPSVITHLIKFPAVFKVSPSVIKITQAFWQLDHGDFTTAMEQLLDPFVLAEDLQPWHHTIAMRSLLVHKQSNFALLYMQIRKPPISDEKDVMTAISLFISNNMLDEAFYFKKQHQNNNEEKLLTHLFRECSKNDGLHQVLYKCLNTEEEKTFFKYLKSVCNPSTEDLQIFYYLLRSRFVEAFDAHSEKKRKHPDRQGLIGQSLSTKADQIVKIFKTLLPDVNKNLVEYIRKERNNLWREVERPTPMSVFVHNTNEQVHYKSTLIHAALAKAKHTFKDNFSDSYQKELMTEETPFLRTPRVPKNGTRIITPVITPKIIDTNDMDDVPSPCKRMKLSPRLSTNRHSPLKSDVQQIILTPIIKRKLSFQQDHSSQSFSNISLCTPQSILKVRHLVQNKESIADEDELQLKADSSLQNTSMRLQPRASLSRTPKRQHVQFDEATRFSSSLSDQSVRQSLEDKNSRKSLSSKDLSSMMSTSDVEEGSDEVFYSPDNSKEEQKADKIEITPPKEEQMADKAETTPPKESEMITKDPQEDSIIMSPRGRRSYKRSIELSPTRSSPRLSKLYSKKSEDEDINQSTSSESTISEKPLSSNTSISTDSLSPKPIKIKGRKSLTRQVLEHNTFSKLIKPIPKEDVVSYTKTKSITVTEKYSDQIKVTSMQSNLRIEDTNTRKSRSFSSSVSKNLILERTIDTDSSTDSIQFEPEIETGLSESLQEYVDNLMASDKKKDKLELEGKTEELPNTHLTFEDEPMEQEENTEIELHQKKQPEECLNVGDQKEQNDDKQPEEYFTIEQNEGKLEAFLTLEQNEEKQLKGCFISKHQNTETQHKKTEECLTLEQNENKQSEECVILEHQNEETQDKQPEECFIVEQMEENDGEDVKESPIFTTLISIQTEENNEANFTEEESFNELEENIFGLTGEESLYLKSKRSPVYSDSDVSDVPSIENAFIEDSLHTTKSYKEDVVVITSSDDDKSSDRSTALSEDNLQLNISYDSNINEQSDNSAYSKTTEEYRDDSSDEHKSEDLVYTKLKEVVDDPKEVGKDSGISEQTRNEEASLVNQDLEEKTTESAIKESDKVEKPTTTEDTASKSSKVDSSTNTTVLENKQIVGEEDKTLEKNKVDQSTNTTISAKVCGEPIPEKKTYPSRAKKLFAEDQTTSSSDTTEGETFRKEVVTVQVHTSDISSKNKEEQIQSPAKRMTRKASALSQTMDIDIRSAVSENEEKKELVIEIMKNDGTSKSIGHQGKEKDVLAKRTRRSLSSSDTPARTVFQRSSSQEKIDCDLNSSLKLIEDSLAVKLTLRKKRSASVDEMRTFSRQRTVKPKEDIREESSERKAQSVSQMPIIAEEQPKGTIKGRKARSVVDSYATSRRMTRRQASIVKDIASFTEENRPNVLEVEELDPINLLDKASFEGNPDPEEKKVYEPSSPSTSATNSIQRNRRRSRSNSVLSEVSTSPSQIQPVTPKRGGRSTRSQTKSPVASVVSTRSRKHSETSSVATEKSESSTPPKRSRKKKLDNDVESVSRSTRSRTLSVSSAKSAASNSSRKLVRAKRIVIANSDLPEITEEKVAEEVDGVSSSSKKRQTRKKT